MDYKKKITNQFY